MWSQLSSCRSGFFARCRVRFAARIRRRRTGWKAAYYVIPLFYNHDLAPIPQEENDLGHVQTTASLWVAMMVHSDLLLASGLIAAAMNLGIPGGRTHFCLDPNCADSMLAESHAVNAPMEFPFRCLCVPPSSSRRECIPAVLLRALVGCGLRLGSQFVIGGNSQLYLDASHCWPWAVNFPGAHWVCLFPLFWPITCLWCGRN